MLQIAQHFPRDSSVGGSADPATRRVSKVLPTFLMISIVCHTCCQRGIQLASFECFPMLFVTFRASPASDALATASFLTTPAGLPEARPAGEFRRFSQCFCSDSQVALLRRSRFRSVPEGHQHATEVNRRPPPTRRRHGHQPPSTQPPPRQPAGCESLCLQRVFGVEFRGEFRG